MTLPVLDSVGVRYNIHVSLNMDTEQSDVSHLPLVPFCASESSNW
jgi:hypothetical protein